MQTAPMSRSTVSTLATLTAVSTTPRRFAQCPVAGTPCALPNLASLRANFDGHGRCIARCKVSRISQRLIVYSSAHSEGYEGSELPETANHESTPRTTPEQQQQQAGPSEGSAARTPTERQAFGSILGIVDQRKQLSMQQRYRALVLTIQAFVRNNTLLQQLATSIDGVLRPLRARKAAFDDAFAAYMEDYEQYLAMETKARWSWEKRHRKELAMLASIPPFIGMTMATVLYEVFVPCSLGFAVLLPLYISWVLYDRWYLSPVVLGMVLIARLKFAPVGVVNGFWCFLWPGVF